MTIIFSTVIALVGVLGIVVVLHGVQSRRAIIITGVLSFVIFYWLVSHFGFSELVLKTALG